MRHIKKEGLSCVLLILFIFGLTGQVFAQGAPRKIVIFQKGFVNEPEKMALLKNFEPLGAVIIKPVPLVNGVAVYLPPQAEEAVKRRLEVLRVDDDLVINATARKPSAPQPTQSVPWGINRINAASAWSTTKGLAVKVAILDTGIDLDHLDLKDNIRGNVNTIDPRKSGNDDNGHGTHVAGITAAVNNTIGVVGVGPEIYLYAVKVLNRSGSGWLSDIIEGLDWCINNKMQVVNMSLGSSGGNQSFHDAIVKTYQAGVVLAVAAGNNGTSGGAVNYPAVYPETIAVSAIGQDDRLAYFSSYGPEVDLTAPGVNINSCYNNGYYKILNGTSMAAPHVAGAAALVLTTPVGAYDLNANGKWDPSEIQDKLEATAENLGLSANEQGAGLVRADLAVQ